MGVNGILNVNKPAGITSFGTLARVRRFTGEKHAGHAGTLDPFATGVLPVCLGYATRLSEYLHDQPKEYLAVVELGTTTDTYDCEGTVTNRSDCGGVLLNDVQDILKSLTGCIDQIPPAYSAIKLGGRQSYKLARAGATVVHKPRTVKIDSIEITRFATPLLEMVVRCGKGTYIRSLAHDIGLKLGCGAHLRKLARQAYGPFRLEHSHSLEEIESACGEGQLDQLLCPADYALDGWIRFEADDLTARQIMRGEDIAPEVSPALQDRLIRAYGPDQRLLAILKFVPDSKLWHPLKVFASP